MDFKRRGVSLDLFVRGSKNAIMESFIQSNLDYTTSMDFDRESNELNMTFSDGSILDIHDADTNESNEGVLHLTYWPGDEENNFDTSEGLFKEIPKMLDDFEISVKGFNIGVVVSEPKDAIEFYTSLESEDDFKVIAFEREDLRFEILQEEDGSYRVFCKSDEANLENLNKEKKELFNTLEEVIDVS